MNIDRKGSHQNWDYPSGNQGIDFGTPPDRNKEPASFLVPYWGGFTHSLRVQVPNNQILTQNLYYNYYYQSPKYPVIGYMDP